MSLINHDTGHHGNEGAITTVLLTLMGSLFKLIEGVEALQVLAYLSYIIAITVGLLTIREKWPYSWPGKWFKKKQP